MDVVLLLDGKHFGAAQRSRNFQKRSCARSVSCWQAGIRSRIRGILLLPALPTFLQNVFEAGQMKGWTVAECEYSLTYGFEFDIFVKNLLRRRFEVAPTYERSFTCHTFRACPQRLASTTPPYTPSRRSFGSPFFGRPPLNGLVPHRTG